MDDGLAPEEDPASELLLEPEAGEGPPSEPTSGAIPVEPSLGAESSPEPLAAHPIAADRDREEPPAGVGEPEAVEEPPAPLWHAEVSTEPSRFQDDIRL
jgi:hypothetical protein